MLYAVHELRDPAEVRGRKKPRRWRDGEAIGIVGQMPISYAGKRAFRAALVRRSGGDGVCGAGQQQLRNAPNALDAKAVNTTKMCCAGQQQLRITPKVRSQLDRIRARHDDIVQTLSGVPEALEPRSPRRPYGHPLCHWRRRGAGAMAF